MSLTRGGTVPAAVDQIVALDFDGGSVTLDGEVYTVEPFDTADISPVYAGMTDAVRRQVRATVAENYQGLRLQILVLPGDTIPEGCAASRILFGGSDPAAYGLAAQIDWYDADRCDDAIVFTNLFRPSQFGRRTLTATELGTAIGNVAAHELGHLLGLNHVSNINDIMDTTGTADTFLLDQEFINSPLHGSIFSLGTQDGLMLLLDTLGASE